MSLGTLVRERLTALTARHPEHRAVRDDDRDLSYTEARRLLAVYDHWSPSRRDRVVVARLFDAAVARLDDAAPTWRDRVDRRTLDVSDGTWCVLGQVFGSYHLGLFQLYGRPCLGGDPLPADAATFAFATPTRLWLDRLAA